MTSLRSTVVMRAQVLTTLVCLCELTERLSPPWQGFDPSYCNGKCNTCQIRSPCHNAYGIRTIWNVAAFSLVQIYDRFRDRPDVRYVSTKRRLNSNRLQGVAPLGHGVTHATTRVDRQVRCCWNERNWVMKMRAAVGMPDAAVRRIEVEIRSGCQTRVESCQNIEMCLSALPGGKTLTRPAGSKPGPCGLTSVGRRLIIYMNTGQTPHRLIMCSTWASQSQARRLIM